MSNPPPPSLAGQPLATSSALPAHHYVGSAAEALDRRAVFARSWQLAAHRSQLAGIGDHVVTEVAGVPLVIVRDEDGELRALHNVCRHRAGPLALCDGRGAKRLRCHYHGWSYALDGRLLSAPEMDTARNFNADSVHLPKAHVASWRDLVFVALGDAPPLRELLHEWKTLCR